MRDYECYFGKTIESIEAEACWATLSHNPYSHADVTKIYISKFVQPETKNYISLIVSTVNQITPCQIVEKGGSEYIEYTLLKRYNNDLILLNFIRNLWSEPFIDYSKNFFTFLSKSRYKDPLKRLTDANMKACEIAKVFYAPGHSNVHEASRLKIKTVEQLKKYTGNSTRGFLTL